MVPFLSVRVTHNTKKVISMFSGDRSRSLTLFQHCVWKEQWATKVSVWACSTDHPPYIDTPCSLTWENWHGHLSLTYEPFAQFNQTSFLMFETTWQIPCATGRCVDRKNGILKPLSFTKICTNLAHFDIPALITLHTYNLSIRDKRQHVHRGRSCPADFVWWD